MLIRQLYAQQPTQQQLADYANAVLNINSYAYAITNQRLPVLQYPPKNYGDFTTNFTPAKQHALNWTDNIFVAMIQLPITITQQAADLFNMEDLYINVNLNKLIANPNDTNAKAGLAKALGIMKTLIQGQVTTITSIQSSLTQFATDIANDATVLATIAQQATADAGDDKTDITNLKSQIATLNSEISATQMLLTVSEIGMGVSIFVGLIGLCCCFIPGAQGLGVGLIVLAVAGEAGSIAGTVILNKQITAMQGQIDSDQSHISGLNQDIILLNGVSTSFDALHNANLQAQTALTVIETMWTNLDATIEAVKTDLTNVGTDTTDATKYQDALDAFGQAETNWNEVVAFANALANINYNWQDSSGTWHNYNTQSPAADQGNVTNIPSKIPQAA